MSALSNPADVAALAAALVEAEAKIEKLRAACRIALECFGDEEGEAAQMAVADIRDVLAETGDGS